MLPKSVTVRDPEYIGNSFPEIRRGFLDVNTPASALPELEMPVEEQKQFLREAIKEIEARRKELKGKLPVKGGVSSQRQKKNLSLKLNREPRFRNKIRTLARMSAVDEFVELGRRIQVLQRSLQKMRSVDVQP